MKTSIPVRRVMYDSFQSYFAPLVGAYRGVRDELIRTDREIEQRRKTAANPSKVKSPRSA